MCYVNLVCGKYIVDLLVCVNYSIPFLMMMLTQSNGDTKSFVEICEPDSYPGHLIPKKGHVWNVQKYVFKADYKEKKPIDVKEIGGGKRQRHGNMLKY